MGGVNLTRQSRRFEVKMNTLFEIFVPLFVAMSPLTVLPIFLSMTNEMSVAESRELTKKAILTAFFIALALVVLGQALFRFLSITVDDLKVAGGIILLLIAVYDLLFSSGKRKTENIDDVGIVPLGTPLIIGPATMTAAVVLTDQHGRVLTLLMLVVNLLIIGLILYYSDKIKKFINPSVSKAFGKVMSLFLAAIAVAMFRSGIMGFIQ